MTSTVPDATARLEQRIAKLEAELERQRRAVRDQSALFRIAALANEADDMRTFYEGVHEILRGLLYAENMYVALYDEERQLISFPYYVDQVDVDVPDARQWDRLGTGQASGVTGFILRTGRLLHNSSADWRTLVDSGEVSDLGADASDYLGVPLKTNGRTIGVLAVQNYTPGSVYDEADEQLLAFVADHIAAALARTRTNADLRQRNAALAIVNDVGQGLAEQLDLTAVTELVGERLHGTFPDIDLFVALFHANTNQISFPYEFADGERIHTEPISAERGLTATVIKTRAPLLLRNTDELEAAGALSIGIKNRHSWLGVPVFGGSDVIGVLGMESTQPYAFDEDDVRLLSTLAASTGAALRNARLFDETNSLLAETTQRNAELAIVNEVGHALAKQLDLTAVTELVGERLHETFPNTESLRGALPPPD